MDRILIGVATLVFCVVFTGTVIAKGFEDRLPVDRSDAALLIDQPLFAERA